MRFDQAYLPDSSNKKYQSPFRVSVAAPICCHCEPTCRLIERMCEQTHTKALMLDKRRKRTQTGHPSFHSRWATNSHHLIHCVDITRFFLPAETTALIKDLIPSLPLLFLLHFSVSCGLPLLSLSVLFPCLQADESASPEPCLCPP